ALELSVPIVLLLTGTELPDVVQRSLQMHLSVHEAPMNIGGHGMCLMERTLLEGTADMALEDLLLAHGWILPVLVRTLRDLPALMLADSQVVAPVHERHDRPPLLSTVQQLLTGLRGHLDLGPALA